MTKHPKAGQPVKVANGPYRGRYFIVSDFLINQYQGKKIENLAKGMMRSHCEAAKSRGVPIDDGLVWGRLYPEMNYVLLHDAKELQVDMKLIEGGHEKVELPPNVEPMSKKRKPKPVKEKPNDPGSAS